jgi:GntR family transcriptional regulator of abcA and norABC
VNKIVNIDWKPNKKNPKPVYRQIVDYVGHKVAGGDWSIGSKLPSQRDLAILFEVNRSTIVTAIDELKSVGILEGQMGSGTLVAGNTWSILMTSNETNWGSKTQSGYFIENLPTIQAINEYEFADNIRRLGTGEMSPKLFPKNYFNNALIKLADEVESLNYLAPLGMDSLRETIAKRMQKVGIDAKKGNVLITSGSLQALQLISICMLKENSTVYCEIPSYINSLRVFQSAGMKMKGVPMDDEGLQYWHMNPDNSKYDTALYTIPTNQNPTGKTMSENRRRELYKYCKTNRIPIIEDDAYGELSYDFVPPKPLKSIDESGMILYLGSVSKSFAPGLRIGWIVGPESVVERLGDVKMQVDYGASSISQLILNELFVNGDYDRFITENRINLKRRRDIMLGAMDKYFKDIATWDVPLGGYYIWTKLIHQFSMEKLFKKALAKGILLNPGYIYDLGNINQYLRLSYVYIDEDEIEGAIRDLSILIGDIKKS